MGGAKSACFLFFPSILFCSLGFAVPYYSQTRLPDESFEEARARYYRSMPAGQRLDSETATDVAKPLEEWDLHTAPDWGDPETVRRRFFAIRDERFLVSAETSFFRRISWLYPDDGCFARAAMVRQLAEDWGYKFPKRIFVFGTLQVNTPNAPGGTVTWWYHTAPLVRAHDEVDVLDAAVNPQAPLPVKEWILKQVADVSEVTVSICEPYSYSASSPCEDTDAAEEKSAYMDQETYLNYEYYRQTELGRDPEEVLGDSPPWVSVIAE